VSERNVNLTITPIVPPRKPKARGADLMSEDAFLAAVLDVVHLYGWKAAHFRPAQTARGWRTAVGGDGTGFPDLVLVHPRKGLIVAELKTATGTLNPEQLAWQAILVAARVRYFLWRPADLDLHVTGVLRNLPDVARP
jgi:hypothetical protein